MTLANSPSLKSSGQALSRLKRALSPKKSFLTKNCLLDENTCVRAGKVNLVLASSPSPPSSVQFLRKSTKLFYAHWDTAILLS